MNITGFKDFAKRLKKAYPESCQLDCPLAPLTSYRVGGKADALVRPATIGELEHIIRLCNQAGVTFFVMGKGTNILVHDNGFRGVVILLEKCCNRLFYEGNLLYTGAGVTVEELVEFCETNGLKGLDYMSGIPGTIGGALKMNAGAFVGEIGDRVIKIDALANSGTRQQIPRHEAQFGYRRADGLNGKILLGCWLVVDRGEREKLRRAREDYLKRRSRKQPLEFPSCGSVFKRPPGDYAGRLIEVANCKGITVGGAMVSPKHANFIVNFNNATANDIYQAIRTVQRKVFNQFGVWLQLEVKLIGFPDEDKQKVESPSYEYQ